MLWYFAMICMAVGAVRARTWQGCLAYATFAVIFAIFSLYSNPLWLELIGA